MKIKFRKYDKDTRKFVCCSYDLDGAEQFINLLDKDGTEIYENDIVQVIEHDGTLNLWMW